MSATSGWNLVAKGGPLNGKRYTVTDQGLELGRADECQVVLPSQNVSRKHARVFLFQGLPYVQDLGSRNGVYVNGAKVQQLGLKDGDSVSMGEFVFEVSTTAAGGPTAGKRRLFMIAGGATVALIAIIAVAGSRSSQPAQPELPPAQPASSSAVKSMFDNLNEPGKPAKNAGEKTAAPAGVAGGQEAPAVVAGDQRSQMVRDHLDRAMLLQEAGKLTEAKEQYERALKLDPDCQLCLARRDRLEREISGLVKRHLDDGMRSFKAMRYDEAVASWEMVLNLSPDPQSAPYQAAQQHITEAKAKLATQNRF